MSKKIIGLLIIAVISLIMINGVEAQTNRQIAKNLQDSFKIGGLLDSTGDTAGFNTTQRDVDPVIANVITVILSFLGVVFLVLMVYGGYIWMTAAGNEEQVTKARNLVIAAIIGLLIVVAAYAISYFVMFRFSTGYIK